MKGAPTVRIIHSDGHGEDVWRDALASCPALRHVRDEGVARFAAFGDLLADVFQLLREPNPQWAPPPWPTIHEHALRDLADMAEFRELRALAMGDPDGTTLAACILGRQLARRLEPALTAALDAEAVRHADVEAAAATDKAVADLAAVVGANHPAVAEARAVAARSSQEAQAAVAAAPTPDADDDRLAAFRRMLRPALQACAATVGQVAEAQGVLGGGGGLDAKLAIAERLETSRKFKDLVAIAGRIRRVALEARACRVKDVPPEVCGVTIGRDVARALPAERAMLGVPVLRSLFFKKLLEGQLMVHEQQGEERLGGGPIVICLDGSGSMAGPREVWSKGVALGYLGIAARERRDVVIGQFGASGELEVHSFPYGSRPGTVRQAEVLVSMERFLNAGGTDLEGALRWAVEQVRGDRKLGAADIVVLTDAEASFSPGFLDDWHRAQQRLGFRSYGVLIGDAGHVAELAQAIQTVTHLTDLTADGPVLQTLFGRD
jgi:hypothetical protein